MTGRYPLVPLVPLSLLAVAATFRSANALLCFDACAFDCGIGGYCSSDGDFCVTAELLEVLGDENVERWVTRPAGCLFDFVNSFENRGSQKLKRGQNLFACQHDGCNVPNKEDCGLDEAIAFTLEDQGRRQSPCFTHIPERNDIFTNMIRGGDQRKDMRGRCIKNLFLNVTDEEEGLQTVEVEVREFSQNSSCLGTKKEGKPNTCDPANMPEEVNVLTCSEFCEDKRICNLNVKTSGPAPSPAEAGTGSPTPNANSEVDYEDNSSSNVDGNSDVNQDDNNEKVLGILLGVVFSSLLIVVALVLYMNPRYRAKGMIKVDTLEVARNLNENPGGNCVSEGNNEDKIEDVVAAEMIDASFVEADAIYELSSQERKAMMEDSPQNKAKEPNSNSIQFFEDYL